LCCLEKTASTDPTQTALAWFGLDCILKINRTKPNRMYFYLTVQMTFNLKTKPTAPRTPLQETQTKTPQTKETPYPTSSPTTMKG
jgi:hypothetical protein